MHYLILPAFFVLFLMGIFNVTVDTQYHNFDVNLIKINTEQLLCLINKYSVENGNVLFFQLQFGT